MRVIFLNRPFLTYERLVTASLDCEQSLPFPSVSFCIMVTEFRAQRISGTKNRLLVVYSFLFDTLFIRSSHNETRDLRD